MQEMPAGRPTLCLEGIDCLGIRAKFGSPLVKKTRLVGVPISALKLVLGLDSITASWLR